jgi:hypothetical protein
VRTSMHTRAEVNVGVMTAPASQKARSRVTASL